jgi:hypothetical protein
MMKLKNNSALYAYLISLSDRLSGTEYSDLVKDLRSAASQSAGLSTEFLGESLIALQRVLESEERVLNAAERDDLKSVIQQVSFVLKR